MSLLLAMIVGILAGLAASLLVRKEKSPDYLIIGGLIGMAGSLLGTGLWLFLFVDTTETNQLFNWSALFMSIIGALVFVLVFNLLQTVSSNKVSMGGVEEEGQEIPEQGGKSDVKAGRKKAKKAEPEADETES